MGVSDQSSPARRNGLRTWTCTATRAPEMSGRCNTTNLWRQPFCTVCKADRPRTSAFTEALEERRRRTPVDLEEYLRLLLARGVSQHRTDVHQVYGDVYVIVTPMPESAGTPAIFAVDENALVPCDSLGKRSW